MRTFITINADAADRLRTLAEREKRTVNAQASWLLEQLLTEPSPTHEPGDSTHERPYETAT